MCEEDSAGRCSDCSARAAGTVFIPVHSGYRKRNGRDGVGDSGSCRKSLCIPDAGRVGIYAIDFGICCTKQWCRNASTLIMGTLALVGGSWLASIFSKEAQVIAAAHKYLKAYAIDCLLAAILFCFIGYFNGCGKTVFVMIQGVVGAFCVRIPEVYFMSRLDDAGLFQIGLATPLSSAVQIFLCLAAFQIYEKRYRQ